MSKKYFATDKERETAVDHLLYDAEGNRTAETDEEIVALQEQMIAEGFGEYDRDGDFYFYETLEEMIVIEEPALEAWEEDSNDNPYNRLVEAAADLYGPFNETEIVKIVLEAIAQKHLGGVH